MPTLDWIGKRAVGRVLTACALSAESRTTPDDRLCGFGVAFKQIPSQIEGG